MSEHPASGLTPPADVVIRGQGELAHPEERQRLLYGNREPALPERWPASIDAEHDCPLSGNYR